jgi:hypothetical protein
MWSRFLHENTTCCKFFSHNGGKAIIHVSGIVGSTFSLCCGEESTELCPMASVYLNGMPLKLSDKFSCNDVDICSGCAWFEFQLRPPQRFVLVFFPWHPRKLWLSTVIKPWLVSSNYFLIHQSLTLCNLGKGNVIK